MSTLEFTISRDVFHGTFTQGRLYLGDTLFGYTCEDTDRALENGGVKIPKETAIPRGRYRLTTSMSTRFSRLMPLIEDVPGFSGIRIHGGNTDRDTEGCPLLGAVRTAEGVAGCQAVNAKLIETIVRHPGECWITVV